MAKLSENSELARERILHVAAELFVEHGFRATSVRAICAAADVNVSMVNYYFHSKEALHLAVFDYARGQALSGVAVDPAAAPAEQLRAVIREFLFNLLSSGPASLFTRLLARESVEPTASMQAIVERDIRPQHELFATLVRAIAGPGLSEDDVRHCVLSIIGQAVFYQRSRPVHELAVPQVRYDAEGVERIADHIYRFSMAALSHLAPAPAAASSAPSQ